MARTRNLKPGFFTNEQLADLPPLTRLFFQGLWLHADKAGRLEDRPRKLKAEILPYDNCDVVAMLDQLEKGGFVQRYSVDSRPLLYLPTFLKHQHPHPKEPDSVIPAPVLIPEIPGQGREITDPIRPSPNIPHANTPSPNTPTTGVASVPFSVDDFSEEPPTEPLVKAIARACKYDLDRCGARILRRVGDCADSLCRLEPELERDVIAGMVEEFGPWHELGNIRSPIPAPEWIPDKWGAFKAWKLNGSRAGPRSHVAEMLDDIERLHESYGNKTAENKPIH